MAYSERPWWVGFSQACVEDQGAVCYCIQDSSRGVVLLLLQGWTCLVPLPNPETMFDALEKEGKDKTFLLGPSPSPPPSSVVSWSLLYNSWGLFMYVCFCFGDLEECKDEALLFASLIWRSCTPHPCQGWWFSSHTKEEDSS